MERSLRYVFLVLLLFLLCSVGVRGAGVSVWDVSKEVLEAVNSLREDPYRYASELGIDNFMELWGRNYDALMYGLLPLEYSPCMVMEAQRIVEEYSSGKGTVDAERYSCVKVSSVISVVVAFENRISMEEALSMMVKSVVHDALMAKPYASPLLFPVYTGLGAVVGSTSVDIGGQLYNVYMLVIKVGVAEKMPMGNYIVGELPSDVRAPVLWTGDSRVKALVWPDGLFLLPSCGGDLCRVSVEKRISRRWVRTVLDVNVSRGITVLKIEDFERLLNENDE